MLRWTTDGVQSFVNETSEVTTNYEGPSIICIPVKTLDSLKSPLPLFDVNIGSQLGTSDLLITDINALIQKQVPIDDVKKVLSEIYSTLEMHHDYQMVKDASQAVGVGETTCCRLLYKGTSTFNYQDGYPKVTFGCGHHGHDYVGVASVRNGKSLMATTAPIVNTVVTKTISPVPPAAKP